MRDGLRAALEGLMRQGQKTLPCEFLYDAAGSALFEAITHLPEYGLTRAERRLLQRHSPEIAALVPGTGVVAELGSGSGVKTRTLLDALPRPLVYAPIDVSSSALERCRAQFALVDGVRFVPLQASYLEGLTQAAALRVSQQRLVVLFLGSTIGNLDRTAAVDFLGDVRRWLRPDDALLLGADLLQDVATMIRAYDDDAGVTAAFNRNLLAHANRELGADFDVRSFAHQARFNAAERRIEMHLVSLRDQRVRLGEAATIRLARGDSIWTESCHKFEADEIVTMGRQAGWICRAQWIDEEWPFAETLFLAPA